MAPSTATDPRDPFISAREPLASHQGLPFLALLSRFHVEAACRALGHHWRKCPTRGATRRSTPIGLN